MVQLSLPARTYDWTAVESGGAVVNSRNVSLAITVLIATMFQHVNATDAESEFKALDIDGSGAISLEEAQADELISANWKGLDANQDGQIDETEFAAGWLQVPEAHPQK